MSQTKTVSWMFGGISMSTSFFGFQWRFIVFDDHNGYKMFLRNKAI